MQTLCFTRLWICTVSGPLQSDCTARQTKLTLIRLVIIWSDLCFSTRPTNIDEDRNCGRSGSPRAEGYVCNGELPRKTPGNEKNKNPSSEAVGGLKRSPQ